MALFDYLKGAKKLGRRFLEKLGRKYTEVADTTGTLAAPHPTDAARTTLEKEFLAWRTRRRTGRGRLHAPEELQDRPTAAGQLKAQDDFFYRGEAVTLVSSFFSAAKYDRETLELTVWFLEPHRHRGAVVSDVTWGEATEFLREPSFGKWYWDNVLVRGSPGQTRKPVRLF